MGNLTLNGATSGQITLAPTAVAGTNTLTLPAKTGNIITSADTGTVTYGMLATGVGGTGPAFSAYLSANQTGISNSVYTKVTLNAEDFDTNNNFDSTTNYRFTPTVAGYYLISGTVTGDASSVNPTSVYASIYKNGSAYKTNVFFASGGTVAGPTVTAVIYFNGSSDYVELYGQLVGSTGGRFDASNQTFMSGVLVRGA